MPDPIPFASSYYTTEKFYEQNSNIDKRVNELGLHIVSFLKRQLISETSGFSHAHFDTKEVSLMIYKLVEIYSNELETLLINPFNPKENHQFNKSEIIEKMGTVISLCKSIFSKVPSSYDMEPDNTDKGHYKASFNTAKEEFYKIVDECNKLLDN